MRGPVSGMPVIGIRAELVSVDCGDAAAVNAAVVRVAATKAASAAMAASSPSKMQPLMRVEVTVMPPPSPASHKMQLLVFGTDTAGAGEKQF